MPLLYQRHFVRCASRLGRSVTNLGLAKKFYNSILSGLVSEKIIVRNSLKHVQKKKILHSLEIRQKGESQNGCFKKAKHAKIS